METKDKIIKDNKLLENINQYLHNEGVIQNDRLKILFNVLHNKLETNIENHIYAMLEESLYSKNEIFQRIYMLFGSEQFKQKLDQFYTPSTIGEFINSLLLENKCVIDPACGTGDLLINYNSHDLHMWDISPSVLELAEFNFKFRGKDAYNIREIDTLLNYSDSNNKFDYCILNPPFGTKTIVSNKELLDKYFLGKNMKKQEQGVLFIERSMNLLNDDGILFVILPNGYLGNNSHKNLRKYIIDNFRLLAIIEMPDNTFTRSGTGVSTSILIIQKRIMKKDYEIFIKIIDNIGYDLSKKNTPLKFKKKLNGEYAYDTNNVPIILSDFPDTKNEIISFFNSNNITNIKRDNKDTNYDFVNCSDLIDLNFSPRLYYRKYKNIIEHCISQQYIKVKDLVSKTNFTFTKEPTSSYNYIDISCVKKCMYEYKEYYGNELPDRAKYITKKNDIIVSRLKGKSLTFTILHEDNLIVSNGFTVLRAKSEELAIILFANLFQEETFIQHRSLLTGSIMESISDSDFTEIYINNEIDTNKSKKIVDSLYILNKEL
jgi:type I restriction enzyme M protein